MARIAVAGLIHRSSTFEVSHTTRRDFERCFCRAGDSVFAGRVPHSPGVRAVADAARRRGDIPVPGFYAQAPPGGMVADTCRQWLLEQLNAALEAAMPFDAVVLELDGTLVTESDEDADGTILAEVRSWLSPGMPLAALVGLHANLSPLMVASCDALVVPKHSRGGTERGECAAELVHRMLTEEWRPQMALATPPMIPRPTPDPGRAVQPLSRLARAWEAEQEVVRVSAARGYSKADVGRLGMGVLVLTDEDGSLAAEVAADVAADAWERREAWCELSLLPYAGEYRHVRRPIYPLDSW